jgi:hypothetical protein
LENSLTTEKTEQDHLPVLVRYFEEAEDLTTDARKLSERDRDYVCNYQWTQEELAILKKRKQPALTINYVKRKVEFLRGFERRIRSDPKAFPRNPNDEQGAEAATDALRFVADQNDFDEVRSEVYENLIVEGYGGADVIVEPNSRGGYDVKIKQIPWDRLFYDPHSRERDFSDAKYKGIVIWMDKDDALQTYPGSEAILETTFASTSISDTYDDRPKFGTWCDNKRSRVRVVQMHYLHKGEWWVSTFTKGGYLVEPQLSPYLDKDGKTACSLIMRSAYIDRENNRYGHVRDMISLQDEINKRRSKALHLINVRQVKYEKGAVPDMEAARRELAKPDGMVEVTPGMMFDVIPTGDMAVAQFQLLQQATGEMQASGPNASMSGKDPRQLSGRAIQAQQQGGAVEIEPLVDDLRQWSRDIYEAVWMRIKQFWTEEKWVRVTDDERNIKWVGLNRQVTLGEKLMQIPEEMRAMQMQRMGLMPNDPRLAQVVEVENPVSGLDVDIIIEEGPDITTLQSEQFEMLTGLAQAGMQIPPKVIIKASNLRNKDQLLDELEKSDAAQAEIGQLRQQLAMATGQAELRKTNAEAADKEASAAQKVASTQKTQAEATNSELEAMQRVAALTQPPMVQDYY